MANESGKDGALEGLFEDQDFQTVEEPQAEQALAVRDERALVALEIAFNTAKEAVQAYSENVGVGQVAVLTNQTMRKGAELTVRVVVPGWPAPLQTFAKVTWSRPDALGLAFLDETPAQKEAWRKLVLDHTSMVERMRRNFSRQGETPVPAKVATRRAALVRLMDELLSDTVLEMLNQSGYVANTDPASGTRPNVIVGELANAEALLNAFKGVPLVLVGASGPNDLARARKPFLRVRAFVGNPPSAAKVVQAVNQVFQGR